MLIALSNSEASSWRTMTAPRGLWGRQCWHHHPREARSLCGETRDSPETQKWNCSACVLFIPLYATQMWTFEKAARQGLPASEMNCLQGSRGDVMRNEIIMERICVKESPWHGNQEEARAAGHAGQMKNKHLQKRPHPLARKVWPVKWWDDVAEHLGSDFKTSCAKAAARALLNEMQELTAMPIKLWWCYQPPCCLPGPPTEHFTAPPGTYHSLQEAVGRAWSPGGWDWCDWALCPLPSCEEVTPFGSSLHPPMPALPWGATGRTPAWQPCANCAGADAALGPRLTDCVVTQRRNGSPKPQKQVYPFTHIKSAPEKLYAVFDTGQPRVCCGRQGCRWGWAAVKWDHSTCRSGAARLGTCHPHHLMARGVSGQLRQRPKRRYPSTAPRCAEPSQAAASCLHTRAHTHTRTHDTLISAQ